LNAGTGDLKGERAFQADQFVDSIGVGTHLTYDDTDYYLQWPKILQSLRELGVRHIRDGYFDNSNNSIYTRRHQALADAGIKTTYVLQVRDAVTPSAIKSFSKNVNDIDGFEAPNECDALQNCGGGGLIGIANMMSLLPGFASSAHSAGSSLIGPSFVLPESYGVVGNLGSTIDYNNIHVYFGGRNPGSTGWGDYDRFGNSYGSFAYWMAASAVAAPTAPTVVTEAGYMSFPTPTAPYTISEETGGKYLPRLLLLSYLHGISRTFLYEFLDEFSSPAYGLIREDFSPKPAYLVIQSLIQQLSDPGPVFSPQLLDYTINGGGPSMKHVLFQKRDGSFWLLLWLEESCYDPASMKREPVTPQTVTLQLNSKRKIQQLSSFNATGHVTVESVESQTTGTTIDVSDQIIVLKIN